MRLTSTNYLADGTSGGKDTTYEALQITRQFAAVGLKSHH